MKQPTSPLRDILAIVDLGGERRPAIIAADLARRTGAHLTGVAIAFDPLVPIYTVAAPIPADFIIAAREQADDDAQAAVGAFQAIGVAAGIPVEARIAESASGNGFEEIVRQCRLTDLVVVGRQDRDRLEPMREALIEAILFQSGTPTLLIPPAGVTEFKTDKAIVAWDGGAIAARAVRAALPLLATAKSVIVAMVDDGRKQAGEPGADIATYLARHDLDVTLRQIANAPSGAGSALLAFAAEESADWLVMGAYGHSRMREFFLGGVTRGVLSSATLPVLMVH
jgi:nucleotide-binding universal stress UspA family protein